MVSIELRQELLAAGIGCAIADSLFNPLEIVKVRLQMEGGPGSIISYRRVYFMIASIIRDEGTLQLWIPGLLPTFLRGLLYSGFRIGMYPTVRNVLNGKLAVEDESKKAKDSHFTTKLVAGGLCGAVGSFIFSPLDLIRINFQKNPKIYASTVSAFRSIYISGGLGSLWCGSSATVMRATLLSACQLSIYDQIKSFCAPLNSYEGTDRCQSISWFEEGPLLHAWASLLSGVVAQGVIMPIDTIKTKMMVVSSSSSTQIGKNSGMISNSDTIVGAGTSILREGGIKGFYRGFAPALMRQAPCILLQVSCQQTSPSLLVLHEIIRALSCHL